MKQSNTSSWGKKSIFVIYCSLAFGITNAQQFQTFSYTGSPQTFTVPPCASSITIDALGAQGGYSGGNGAMIEGSFTVTPNTIYTVIVGQMGYSPSGNSNNSGGGGGGSFVYTGNTLLVAAGGGGGRCGYSGAVGASTYGTTSANGSATSGNSAQGGSNGQGGSAGSWGGGGAGWLSNGTPVPYGGYSTPGWAAGTGDCSGGGGGCGGAGGYGGGGGGGNAYGGGGGGGGYSGGGGGVDPQHGGGGGSYNGGTNQINNTGYNAGNGSVTIYWNLAGSLTLSGNVINNVLCNGQSNAEARGIVSGGGSPFTYSWTPVGGNKDTASGLSAGSYILTVKDACGNTATASVSVTQPNALNVSATALSNVLCNGGTNGSAFSTVSGGTSPYTYLWSNFQNGPNISGLSAGTYSLGVLDANGCTGTASVSITQPNVLNVSATALTNVLCNGGTDGSVSSTVSGGTSPYTYLWSNFQNGPNISGLSAGTYSLGVLDANGCAGTASVSITEPNPLNLSAATLTNVLCNGGTDGSASSTVSGGTSPYTYAWSNLQNSANATGLSAGTYTLSLTDANGCTGTASASITQPTAINIVKHSVPDDGHGTGVAWINVSGGTGPYTYLWTPGGNTTDSIAQKDSGSYCCTVKDANGCIMDTVCISIQSTLGIANITSGSGEITIYPNPNNGRFTIQSSVAGGQRSVEIYNVLGEKVYSTPLTTNNSSFTVNISSQPNGIYLYRVLSESGYLVGEGKITVQK